MLRGTGKSGKELATAGYWTIRGRCGLLPASLVPLGRCELRNALEEDQGDGSAGSRRKRCCTVAHMQGPEVRQALWRGLPPAALTPGKRQVN